MKMPTMKIYAVTLVCAAALLGAWLYGAQGARAQAGDAGARHARAHASARAPHSGQRVVSPGALLAAAPCTGGVASGYPCLGIDLLAFVPASTFGAPPSGFPIQIVNDSWGWTDPSTGVPYALVGVLDGIAFVDLSDPASPVYVGKLPTHSQSEQFADVKVYADHAFIVRDLVTGHGVQVFDLTQLRQVIAPPVTFSETAHFGGMGRAHNIAINEATGYAYMVWGDTCGGGMHMLNIQSPTSPVDAGCYTQDGYVHDTQCVVYSGPDTEHLGSEVCFNANTTTMSVVDVTNKGAPVRLGGTGYPSPKFANQGWLTEDQTYFLMGDEADEGWHALDTRTFIFDVSDLDNPQLTGIYVGGTPASDKNLYVRGDYAFLANYTAGLRVLDLSDIASGSLSEVAYFDTFPLNDNPGPPHTGAWNVYPFFDANMFFVTGFQGLFVFSTPDLALTSLVQSGTVEPDGTLTYALTVRNDGSSGVTGLALTNTLSDGVTFASASAGCTHDAGVVTCAMSDLAAGGSAVVNITVDINSDAGGLLLNTAQVSANEFEFYLDNNAATQLSIIVENGIYLPAVFK